MSNIDTLLEAADEWREAVNIFDTEMAERHQDFFYGLVGSLTESGTITPTDAGQIIATTGRYLQYGQRDDLENVLHELV
ncbi:hypothetical protein [Stackebrandtia nassauensis]|uniref:Uncharacterized protein n=1 Tax=Stackebrandtia nassauensis (strain DSM 44728 / CIP 108903 / NRRL B-16338 / NBRC 102104 / LLR-40K-21) TaxID=446470 RepID=D3Q374_STANL|nr:hypothetical protein [Stackebrandtia nassauensis]ADD40044.1 hypothetical protein Snas_0326 [Stackebrandtia nassauensis DSM 44728]